MTYEVGANNTAIARDGDAVWPSAGRAVKPLNPPPAPPGAVLPAPSPVRRSHHHVSGERDTDRLESTFIDDYATFQPTRARSRPGRRLPGRTRGRSHTATVRGAVLSTAVIAPGATGSITFEKPGTYIYTCLFHPWLSAQVIVDTALRLFAAPACCWQAAAPARQAARVAGPEVQRSGAAPRRSWRRFAARQPAGRNVDRSATPSNGLNGILLAGRDGCRGFVPTSAGASSVIGLPRRRQSMQHEAPH